LNRTVWEAEERLEHAKRSGRDRVCLLDEQPILWKELPEYLQDAQTLSQWLRDKLVSTALIYKLLYFAEQRHRAEGRTQDGQIDMACVDWRARWAYHLARNVRGRQLPAEVEIILNRLLGLDADLRRQDGPPPLPRIPVSIALYRNRS
jgi:hypothetical protein